MAPSRPATTGYERLSQADQFSDSDDDDPLGRSFASLQHPAAPRYGPIGQPRPHSGMTSPRSNRTLPNNKYHHHGQHPSGRRGGGGRRRSNSGVDLKAINARLERWADEIAAKFKRHRAKRAGDEEERLEIHHTVFQAPEGFRSLTAENLADPSIMGKPAMSRDEFEAVVESVRVAIEQGVHPRMISQGSSGSYFARNADGKVVGVFKPKDEEPYAAGNPKWNKWIHRNLFPCCFGRACLIPNLSYVSEAAAYVLDCQLRTFLVPYTDVVYLSSKSFHYPFWDRYAHSRNRKPLPAKPGSFQVFLKGFKDANIFLREHPWPDQYLSGFRTNEPHRNRRRRWADNCRAGGPAGVGDEYESDEEGGRVRMESGAGSGEASSGGSRASPRPGPGNFVWTEGLKQSFREELEKLVILDYIMRNTDRGLDNWMIKVDRETQEVSIVSERLHLRMENGGANGSGSRREDEQEGDVEGPRPVDVSKRKPAETRASYPYSHQYRVPKPMDASTPPPGSVPDPKISIGAIDNSLSWPWKHPDGWRSFPFGWLFLPVDLIGRPFSQKTRDHFLPLLTSTHWWSQTQLALRRVFQIDPDFQERMFARQVAVMKGQAWNVVETLKTPDHGPLELTRRTKVCVWDDLVDVPVAVPMRATSSEARRHRNNQRGPASEDAGLNGQYSGRAAAIEEEELDIAAAAAPSSPGARPDPAGLSSSSGDLLGLSSSPAELPHQGRFGLASGSGGEGEGSHESGLDVGAGAVFSSLSGGSASPPPKQKQHGQRRPRLPPRSTEDGGERGGPPYSYHGPQTRFANGSGDSMPYHEQRFSFTTAAGRRNSNSIAYQLYGGGGAAAGSSSQGGGRTSHDSYDSNGNYLYNNDDEDDEFDGDLGYAAAEGMEGNRRKVIVERLEPVKTKNPVFTWC